MNPDFLIVGAGIGGTVLAELLGRGGRKVLVLEKETAAPQWVRPEILWPATVRQLFSLAPKQTWEEDALLRQAGIKLHTRRGAFQLLSLESLAKTGVERWAADAGQLRERLMRLDSFELRRGVEVIEVLEEKNRIVGVRSRHLVTGQEVDLLASWTIGDDGVHSRVRQACGLEMKTKLFPIDFLCFGFSWPASFEAATPNAWLDIDGPHSAILALLAVPLPQRRGAGVLLVRPELFETDGLAEQAWRQFCSIDAAIQEVIHDKRFPEDFVRVRRPWGHAQRYGREGAILMGDAAHPVSPAGGQGANMSVADARVMADIALHAPSHLLEEYERRRREANARSLRFTQGAARLLALPGWTTPPTSLLISVVRWANRHPSVITPFIRYVSTAFEERRR